MPGGATQAYLWPPDAKWADSLHRCTCQTCWPLSYLYLSIRVIPVLANTSRKIVSFAVLAIPAYPCHTCTCAYFIAALAIPAYPCNTWTCQYLSYLYLPILVLPALSNTSQKIVSFAILLASLSKGCQYFTAVSLPLLHHSGDSLSKACQYTTATSALQSGWKIAMCCKM